MPSSRSARLPSSFEFKNPEHLHDWTNLDAHLWHLERYSPEQQELLRSIRDKLNTAGLSDYRDEWGQLNWGKRYQELATLIAISAYDRRNDLVHCGYCRPEHSESGYSQFRCRDGLLCPRCSYWRCGKPLVDEFGGAFGMNGDVYCIVMSLSAEQDHTKRLVFRDVQERDLPHLGGHGLAKVSPPEAYGIEFTTLHDVKECHAYWKFYAQALKELSKGRGRRLTGAIRIHELAVQLRPLRVLPHCNVIGWGYLCEDDAHLLREAVRRKIRNSRTLHSSLYPSIHCYRLHSSEELKRVLSYSFKAIDLGGAYIQAAERVGHAPAEMDLLNQEANTFLSHLPAVFQGVVRRQVCGECLRIPMKSDTYSDPCRTAFR